MKEIYKTISTFINGMVIRYANVLAYLFLLSIAVKIIRKIAGVFWNAIGFGKKEG